MWITVSGRIGSGKTTLSRALSASHEMTYAGIGDFVRAHARREGVPLERRRLQELGARLIAAAGGDAAFIRDVVGAAEVDARGMVVDGVRTLAMRAEIDTLGEASEVLHIHVEVPETTRRERLYARGDADAGIAEADADTSEGHIDDLRATADLIAPGDDLEAALALIADAVAHR